LQEDARLSLAELGRRVGLSATSRSRTSAANGGRWLWDIGLKSTLRKLIAFNSFDCVNNYATTISQVLALMNDLPEIEHAIMRAVLYD